MNSTPPSQEGRVAPTQIRNRLSAWWRAFWFWNIVHYGFGLTSTILTVVVAAGKSDKLTTMIFGLPHPGVVAVVVAICTSILTFARAANKSNAYIQAWRLLDVARIRYELDPEYPCSKLTDVLSESEKIIGKAD